MPFIPLRFPFTHFDLKKSPILPKSTIADEDRHNEGLVIKRFSHSLKEKCKQIKDLWKIVFTLQTRENEMEQ